MTTKPQSEIDLRLGRWQDVLADVECDALVVDAPYSEKTHAAHAPRTSVLTACERDAKWAARGGKRRSIGYEFFSPEDVRDFVQAWAPRTRGWFVSITDDLLAPVWRAELEAIGRYAFAPLACVDAGSRVRLAGDGPSNWTVYAVVARPRQGPFKKWGTLPGAYVVPAGQRGLTADRKPVMGGKPIWLMQALVRDYSRPGDLVCDPCAGAGTTLLAAAVEGRRAVGAECLPAHYEIAQKRLGRGYTPTLFTESSR